MNVIQQNVSLTMVRDNLEGIPNYRLPGGYALRGYRPGDEQHWEEIHLLADRYSAITPDRFRQEFGTDGAVLRERQLYLLEAGGQAIGTATAWFDDSFGGLSYGRVHWVAIVPQYQRRGLARPLMAAVCRRLRALGYARAFLRTTSVRIPAIRLYLQFGFIPWIDSLETSELWRQLEQELAR